MTTLHDDFAMVLKERSLTRGLARRLVDNVLRPDERKDLDRVEIVVRMEEEGHKYPVIARELGWTAQRLRQWVQSEKYRVFRKYCAERVLIVDEQQAFARRTQERRRFEANGVKALDYYDQAFKKHQRDVKNADGSVKIRRGEFVDMNRAERAAAIVARAMGWTEPLAQQAKPKTLQPGIIQAQMHGMAAADRRETVVRVTVGDTTVEVGSRETASMGGDA